MENNWIVIRRDWICVRGLCSRIKNVKCF